MEASSLRDSDRYVFLSSILFFGLRVNSFQSVVSHLLFALLTYCKHFLCIRFPLKESFLNGCIKVCCLEVP